MRHRDQLQTGGVMSRADTFPCSVGSRFCWVEQVRESPQFGALFSRLHQRGQVLGRGSDVLYVRFEDEGQLIGVAPQLVRLLPDASGGG
jgi:hypothetical protein